MHRSSLQNNLSLTISLVPSSAASSNEPQPARRPTQACGRCERKYESSAESEHKKMISFEPETADARGFLSNL